MTAKKLPFCIVSLLGLYLSSPTSSRQTPNPITLNSTTTFQIMVTTIPRFVEKIRIKAATMGIRLRSAKSLCEKLKNDTKAFLLCIQKGNKSISHTRIKNQDLLYAGPYEHLEFKYFPRLKSREMLLIVV